LRLFKDIFREVEALIISVRLLLKISRLFEDIFNGFEAFLK
jgi:hypothetical protein